MDEREKRYLALTKNQSLSSIGLMPSGKSGVTTSSKLRANSIG